MIHSPFLSTQSPGNGIRVYLRLALCLSAVLLLTASPVFAASLHDFATRWGKATVSTWPPAEDAPLPPNANGTRQTVVPAEGVHNATTPARETKAPLPHPASGTTNATAPSVGGNKNATAPATATPATSAGDTAAPVHAQEPQPQTNRAQPAPGSRPPGALPDGMPSSPLGNGTLLTAPAAAPRT